jgi:hypothetical protein
MEIEVSLMIIDVGLTIFRPMRKENTLTCFSISLLFKAMVQINSPVGPVWSFETGVVEAVHHQGYVPKRVPFG